VQIRMVDGYRTPDRNLRTAKIVGLRITAYKKQRRSPTAGRVLKSPVIYIRAAIYIRASADDHTMENEERELREVAERAGWHIVKVYRDKGANGAGSVARPRALEAIRRDAARQQIDMVMVWSVDQLGNSLNNPHTFLFELDTLKIDFYLHREGIDTTVPSGKILVQTMLGSLPESERVMIRERIKSGSEPPRMHGKKRGRPSISPEKENEIRLSLIFPLSGKKTIAKNYGVSVGIVRRIQNSFKP
jgi:DNA invertase Pin-like site-specific DNA recombinase